MLGAIMALLAATGPASATPPATPIRAVRPRVEYIEGPALGLDTLTPPRFSFVPVGGAARGEQLVQYRVVVRLLGDTPAPPLWDSGPVEATSSQQITPPPSVVFPPDSSFEWTAVWWAKSDPTTASPPLVSTFSTGIGTSTDGHMQSWRGAAWIVAGKSPGHPMGNQLRRAFHLGAEPVRAALYVSCMGYYRASVNGKAASNMTLGDFTNYEKRLWYSTHNVTGLLTAGENVLGFVVSGGWDSRHGSGKNGNSVLVRLSVDLADGTHVDVVSDTAFTGGAGALTAADIYNGETWNASKATPGWDAPGFTPTTGTRWANCSVGGSPHNVTKHPWNRPSVIASHAPLPQIEVTGTAAPVDFWKAAPESWVFDFGVNRAAVTTLTIPADVATKLGTGATWIQQASEALACAKPCGINTFSSSGAAEIITYISDPALNSDGGGLGSAAISFMPHFTQMGFRYIQLNFSGSTAWTPDNTSLIMAFINTAAKPISDISFSDPMLNVIQDMSLASAASNWMSIPTDCPQRAERLGWMGDAYTSGETQLHSFDLAGAYTSWLDQIEDNQANNASDTAKYGAVPDCVPFYGGHCHLPSSPSWGQAYPSLANWVFEYYDDLELVNAHYGNIKLYTDSLTARAKVNDAKNHTLLDTGGWGDWCAPGGCGGTGTCGGSHDYISTIRIMKRWAAAVNNSADLETYSALEAKVAAAFDAAYFSTGGKGPKSKRGYTCTSTRPQTANALGLQVSPGGASATVTLAALVSDIEAKDFHVDTGIVGTKWLFESLAENGRADLALAQIVNPTYPGYGYWASQGATSLWETWEGERYKPAKSWNHVMFGSVTEFFFRHLAGINQRPGTRGFSSIVFKPAILMTPKFLAVCASLSSVSSRLLRPNGEIVATWYCAADHRGISYTIHTPVGVPSSAYLPVAAKAAATVVTFSDGAGAGVVVWTGSKYVSGVAGVKSAMMAPDGKSVVVGLGPGAYTFTTTPA